MNDTRDDASLELLLDELNRGDLAAAEQVFRKYEPYLRMVVRRQLSGRLRAKFDSQDIVQSVWVNILERLQDAGWRFDDVAHLRAFLVRATRNRLIDRQRQHGKRGEQALPASQVPASPEAGPSTVMQAEDLWDKLVALCPPAHRDILELKRQGADLAEIADKTGLHPSSVRRILYDLARRLALKD
jgi:RNA polymerase sigma factor (sigma-70 family)